jgi:maltose O-acetyltransferase
VPARATDEGLGVDASWVEDLITLLEGASRLASWWMRGSMDACGGTMEKSPRERVETPPHIGRSVAEPRPVHPVQFDAAPALFPSDRLLAKLRATARGYFFFACNRVRSKCFSFGPRPQLTGRLHVRGTRNITIGGSFKAFGTPVPIKLQTGGPGRLEIGERVFVNYGADIHARLSIRIGDNVHLAPFVSIVDDDMHMVDLDRGRSCRSIAIEDGVWLGRLVTVLPGVTIGANTVVGAGSVVTSSLPAGVLAAGSPARVIRSLNAPENWRRS